MRVQGLGSGAAGCSGCGEGVGVVVESLKRDPSALSSVSAGAGVTLGGRA